jgi:hypothetical protein
VVLHDPDSCARYGDRAAQLEVGATRDSHGAPGSITSPFACLKRSAKASTARPGWFGSPVIEYLHESRIERAAPDGRVRLT